MNNHILCISLNPAIDTTIGIPALQVGAVNRAVSVASEPAGKAINVATLLSQLNARFGGIGQIGVAGFLGADNQGEFIAKFDKFCLKNHCISVNGSTRQNIKLAQDDGTTTDVNGIGFVISDDDKVKFFDNLNALLPNFDFVVVSGSLPKGFDLADFAKLLNLLEFYQKPYAVDTSGKALQVALEYRPFLIKPNETELGEIFGVRLDTLDSQHTILPKLKNIENVVLSMGEQGVHWFFDRQLLKANTPKVAVKSTVGAGDTLLSGVVFGLLTGGQKADILRRAVAMAGHAVSQVGFELVDDDRLDELSSQITVDAFVDFYNLTN